MRPAGPSGPSGTSHSNVHLPGKYSSKLNGGSASSDFVGRPRSGIWPFGSGVCACRAEAESRAIGEGGTASSAITSAAAEVSFIRGSLPHVRAVRPFLHREERGAEELVGRGAGSHEAGLLVQPDGGRQKGCRAQIQAAS